MTDPTIQKTWEFALNGVALANTTLGATNAHQDRREMLLDIVQALTNAGPHTGTFTVPWTVVQSSNGSTAGTPGPGWSSISNLVWRDEDSPGTPYSWILLQQTGISATFQLLIGLESDTVADDGAQIFAAVGQVAFGAGGTTTTAPALPSDGRVLRDDDGTSQGYWGSGTDGSAVNPAYRWDVAMSSDGKCTRVFIFVDTINTGFWLFDVPDNPASGWTNPYVATIFGESNFTNNVCRYGNFLDAANMKGRYSGTDTTMFLSSEGFADSAVGEQMRSNQLNNTWPVSEIGVYSETSTFMGRMGTLFDLWWGEDAIVSGRYYPQTGTKLYANVARMIVPWDGSSLMGTR